MDDGGGEEANQEPAAANQPPTSGADASAPASQGPQGHRAWLWVAITLVAVAIVGVLIGSRLGGLSGPLSNQSAGNGRPTIVVGTGVAAAPSVVASPSPSVAPSTVVAGATAVAAGSEYVVQPGDTLRSIAEDQYGDAEQWSRIYDANRDTIGANPDVLVAGTTLQIPPRQ
jgi:LysM repeat protein